MANSRTPVGLADLVVSCASLQPDSDEEIAKIASLLGLSLAEPLEESVSGETDFLRTGSSASDSFYSDDYQIIQGLPGSDLVDGLGMDDEWMESAFDSMSPLQRKLEASKIWKASASWPLRAKRGVHATQGSRSPEAVIPADISEAEPWPKADEDEAGELFHPLLTPGISRSFIRDSVVTWKETGEPDINRLVDHFARGRSLQSIPKTMQRRVDSPPHFLIDTSDPMFPYLEDAESLVILATSVIGCKPAQITWSAGCPDFSGEDETRPMVYPRRRESLVVISLLGLNDTSDTRNQWHRFADEMHRKHVRLIAITPALITRRDSMERRHWKFVPWMPPGGHYQFATQSHVEKMATLLSLVMQPDINLLRRLREYYFPNVEPYLESMVLQSKWVAAAYPSRIMMHSRCVSDLQARSTTHPELLTEIQHIRLSDDTGSANPQSRQALAEQVLIDAHSIDPGADQRLKHGLARIIKTLLAEVSDITSARFFHSLLEHIPPSARNMANYTIAGLLIKNSLGQSLDRYDLKVSHDQGSWLYPKNTLAGLAWNEHRLFIRDIPRSGDTLISIPDTPLRQLRLEWDSHRTEWRTFFSGHRESVTSPFLPQSVVNLRGERFGLSLPDESLIWSTLNRSLQSEEIISGTIVGSVKRQGELKGFLVNIGITAFLPIYHFVREKNVTIPEQYINEQVDVIVTQLNKASRDIIVSEVRKPDDYKKKQEKEDNKKQVDKAAIERFISENPVGTITRGRVTNLAPYGAFISLAPGVDGLLHNTEISHVQKNTITVQELFRVDEEIDVEIKKTNAETSRIQLTRLSLMPHPWEQVQKLPLEGQLIRASITKIVDYGIFAQVREGIDGLLHISEMPENIRTDLTSHFEKGQEIDVLILTVDPERRRIALGLPASLSK